MSDSVLVTGSSRGIGKAIALELSKSGYQVVVHYLSRQEEAEAITAPYTVSGLIPTKSTVS